MAMLYLPLISITNALLSGLLHLMLPHTSELLYFPHASDVARKTRASSLLAAYTRSCACQRGIVCAHDLGDWLADRLILQPLQAVTVAKFVRLRVHLKFLTVMPK